MDKIKLITRFIGDILLLLAISMILPLIISIIKGETASLIAFIATIGLCVLLCLIAFIFSRKSQYTFKFRDGFIVTSLVWIIVTFIGALPYYFSLSIPSFSDCIFESASGFTTTGASVIPDVESLPRSILFWRSMTNWIGGMGILVLLSAILSSWGINGQTIAFNESTGPSKSKLTSRFSDTAKMLYGLYIFITGVLILLLKLCKLSWFDAVTHSFSTVATGGFSTYNNGIMHFESPIVRIVLIIFMIIAGMNFNLLLQSRSKTKIMNLFKDKETRFYLGLLTISSLIIFLYNYGLTRTNFASHLLDAFFQVVSIVTTTGYATTDFNIWPTFTKAVIIALFFTGACASSTSGGIKCIRHIICFKLIKRSISLKVHPNRVANITLNNKQVSTDTVIRVTTFMLTYITMIIIGTLLISTSGFDFITNLTAASSCLGNIGPGLGAVGPTSTYIDYSNFSKIVCSLLMIIGRLEILPFFVIFSRNYWNPNKVK